MEQTWSRVQRTRPVVDPARSGRERWLSRVAVLAVVPAMVAAGAGTVVDAAPAAAAPGGRPDLVLILTDDQRLDDLVVMPTVQAELVARGTSYPNTFSVNATCCPSRSALMTGRHSHANGTYTNDRDCHGPNGFDDRSTLATSLQATGYRTSLVGKYLNSYETTVVPPGWSDWHAFSGYYDNSGGAYYDYQLSENGSLTSHGATAADYSTDVLATRADAFIRSTPPTQPLFLMFTPFGPHGGQKPAPRHRGLFDGMVIPHGADFNEADVSDKPDYIKSLPLLTADEVSQRNQERRRSRETLLSVDEAVGTILTALRDTGRLENTMIVFQSDQGFSRGEHRFYERKLAPYEDVIAIPHVVRWDALGRSARTDPQLVANIDLAPTFVEAAGATFNGTEGRSLLASLRGQPSTPRPDVLIEHVQTGDPVPTYCAVRTPTRKFVRYATGELELYDLVADPHETENAATKPAYAADLAALEARVRLLCHPPSRLTAVRPYRLFDTRTGGPLGGQPVRADGTLVVKVTGTGTPAVPANAVAVALTVTATASEGEGFVTVYPTGSPLPNASVLNFGFGDTAPNFLVAPIGADGQISFFVGNAGSHVLADVTGFFTPITGRTAIAGRYQGLAPDRILDTRVGPKPAAGATVPLRVVGRGGIPDRGVSAVALNVTAVDATSPGFVTVYPGGTQLPLASNLNLVRPGQIRANQVVVPVGADGTVNLYTEAGTHLLADVAGYFTDATAPASGSGLFVPVQPIRLRDTRVTPPAGPLPLGGTIDTTVTVGLLPPSAAVALLNVTAVGVASPGYVTVHPSGVPRPNTSTLNLDRSWQTIPNAAVVRLGASAQFTAYSEHGTYLIFDAMGYFTS